MLGIRGAICHVNKCSHENPEANFSQHVFTKILISGYLIVL